MEAGVVSKPSKSELDAIRDKAAELQDKINSKNIPYDKKMNSLVDFTGDLETLKQNHPELSGDINKWIAGLNNAVQYISQNEDIGEFLNLANTALDDVMGVKREEAPKAAEPSEQEKTFSQLKATPVKDMDSQHMTAYAQSAGYMIAAELGRIAECADATQIFTLIAEANQKINKIYSDYEATYKKYAEKESAAGRSPKKKTFEAALCSSARQHLAGNPLFPKLTLDTMFGTEDNLAFSSEGAEQSFNKLHALFSEVTRSARDMALEMTRVEDEGYWETTLQTIENVKSNVKTRWDNYEKNVENQYKTYSGEKGTVGNIQNMLDRIFYSRFMSGVKGSPFLTDDVVKGYMFIDRQFGKNADSYLTDLSRTFVAVDMFDKINKKYLFGKDIISDNRDPGSDRFYYQYQYLKDNPEQAEDAILKINQDLLMRIVGTSKMDDTTYEQLYTNFSNWLKDPNNAGFTSVAMRLHGYDAGMFKGFRNMLGTNPYEKNTAAGEFRKAYDAGKLNEAGAYALAMQYMYEDRDNVRNLWLAAGLNNNTDSAKFVLDSTRGVKSDTTGNTYNFEAFGSMFTLAFADWSINGEGRNFKDDVPLTLGLLEHAARMPGNSAALMFMNRGYELFNYLRENARSTGEIKPIVGLAVDHMRGLYIDSLPEERVPRMLEYWLRIKDEMKLSTSSFDRSMRKAVNVWDSGFTVGRPEEFNQYQALLQPQSFMSYFGGGTVDNTDFASVMQTNRRLWGRTQPGFTGTTGQPEQMMHIGGALPVNPNVVLWNIYNSVKGKKAEEREHKKDKTPVSVDVLERETRSVVDQDEREWSLDARPSRRKRIAARRAQRSGTTYQGLEVTETGEIERVKATSEDQQSYDLDARNMIDSGIQLNRAILSYMEDESIQYNALGEEASKQRAKAARGYADMKLTENTNVFLSGEYTLQEGMDIKSYSGIYDFYTGAVEEEEQPGQFVDATLAANLTSLAKGQADVQGETADNPIFAGTEIAHLWNYIVDMTADGYTYEITDDEMGEMHQLMRDEMRTQYVDGGHGTGEDFDALMDRIINPSTGKMLLTSFDIQNGALNPLRLGLKDQIIPWFNGLRQEPAPLVIDTPGEINSLINSINQTELLTQDEKDFLNQRINSVFSINGQITQQQFNDLVSELEWNNFASKIETIKGRVDVIGKNSGFSFLIDERFATSPQAMTFTHLNGEFDAVSGGAPEISEDQIQQLKDRLRGQMTEWDFNTVSGMIDSNISEGRLTRDSFNAVLEGMQTKAERKDVFKHMFARIYHHSLRGVGISKADAAYESEESGTEWATFRHQYPDDKQVKNGFYVGFEMPTISDSNISAVLAKDKYGAEAFVGAAQLGQSHLLSGAFFNYGEDEQIVEGEYTWVNRFSADLWKDIKTNKLGADARLKLSNNTALRSYFINDPNSREYKFWNGTSLRSGRLYSEVNYGELAEGGEEKNAYMRIPTPSKVFGDDVYMRVWYNDKYKANAVKAEGTPAIRGQLADLQQTAEQVSENPPLDPNQQRQAVADMGYKLGNFRNYLERNNLFVGGAYTSKVMLDFTKGYSAIPFAGMSYVTTEQGSKAMTGFWNGNLRGGLFLGAAYSLKEGDKEAGQNFSNQFSAGFLGDRTEIVFSGVNPGEKGSQQYNTLLKMKDGMLGAGKVAAIEGVKVDDGWTMKLNFTNLNKGYTLFTSMQDMGSVTSRNLGFMVNPFVLVGSSIQGTLNFQYKVDKMQHEGINLTADTYVVGGEMYNFKMPWVGNVSKLRYELEYYKAREDKALNTDVSQLYGRLSLDINF